VVCGCLFKVERNLSIGERLHARSVVRHGVKHPAKVARMTHMVFPPVGALNVAEAAVCAALTETVFHHFGTQAFVATVVMVAYFHPVGVVVGHDHDFNFGSVLVVAATDGAMRVGATPGSLTSR
jgi:hypothetical protein